MDNYPVFIFISPHLDDAVFSCGGYMHQLASLGKRVVLVTVITADDDSSLPPSPIAQRYLRCSGGVKNIFAIRCLEDRAAADYFGVKVLHMGFLDAMYRRDSSRNILYPDRAVGIKIQPYDWNTFASAIDSALKSLLGQYSTQDVTVFCPLATGGHVDHVIIRHALAALTTPRQRLYYEDFPYVLHSRDGVDGLAPITITLQSDDVKARVQASALYSSQLPAVFYSRLDFPHVIRSRLPSLARFFPIRMSMKGALQRMEMSITQYIQQVGGERYWKCVS